MSEMKILHKNVGGVFQGEERFVPVVELDVVDEAIERSIYFAEKLLAMYRLTGLSDDSVMIQEVLDFLASPTVTDWRARQKKKKKEEA